MIIYDKKISRGEIMAEVALKMGVRKPRTLAEMVKLTGMEEKHVEKLLEEMSFSGVVEYNWENPKHEKQYVLPMFVPGSAEFTNMNATILEKYPEMGRFFERMKKPVVCLYMEFLHLN